MLIPIIIITPPSSFHLWGYSIYLRVISHISWMRQKIAWTMNFAPYSFQPVVNYGDIVGEGVLGMEITNITGRVFMRANAINSIGGVLLTEEGLTLAGACCIWQQKKTSNSIMLKWAYLIIFYNLILTTLEINLLYQWVLINNKLEWQIGSDPSINTP